MGDLTLRECGRWLSANPGHAESRLLGRRHPAWITSSRSGGATSTVGASTHRGGRCSGKPTAEPGTPHLRTVRGMSLKKSSEWESQPDSLRSGRTARRSCPPKASTRGISVCALEAAEDRVLRMVDEASHGTGRLQTSLLGSLEGQGAAAGGAAADRRDPRHDRRNHPSHRSHHRQTATASDGLDPRPGPAEVRCRSRGRPCQLAGSMSALGTHFSSTWSRFGSTIAKRMTSSAFVADTGVCSIASRFPGQRSGQEHATSRSRDVRHCSKADRARCVCSRDPRVR